METKNKKYNRRSIRLQRYDYSLPGAYFITICIHKQKMLLKIKDVQMMIQSVWSSLPDRFFSLKLDEFVIMPNHIHAILCINIVGADLVSALNKADLVSARNKTKPISTPTISRIVQAFKSITTYKYILGVEENNWPLFDNRLWQRNYHDHIIRSEKSLNYIREYIVNNPIRWEFDKENPQGKMDEKEENFWKEINS
ncbi:transposase [bacterium]|nr:transposase [bacterium]